MGQELNLSTEETTALDRIDAELRGSSARGTTEAKAPESLIVNAG